MKSGNGCQGRKSNGATCGSPPTASGFCFFHDPSRREEQKAAVRLGGLASRPRTFVNMQDPRLCSPSDVVQLMESLCGQVGRGELHVSIANSIGYLAGISLRSMEVELSRRLEALELAVKNRGMIRVS